MVYHDHMRFRTCVAHDLDEKTSDPDADVFDMTGSQLRDEIRKLRKGIRSHRDNSGHNLCWYVPELWDLLPEKVRPAPDVPPREEFRRRCAEYYSTLKVEDPVGFLREELAGEGVEMISATMGRQGKEAVWIITVKWPKGTVGTVQGSVYALPHDHPAGLRDVVIRVVKHVKGDEKP